MIESIFLIAVGFFQFLLGCLLRYYYFTRLDLPPAILGPSVLSKRVETDSTGTQIGLTCVQTMPHLPGACLW